MKRIIVSALGLLSAVACSKAETTSEAPPLSRAEAAIRALSTLDGEAVSQCERAVEACNERVPDAAPVDVCGRLATRCAALNERLSEGRGPAVGCWTALQACEAAPEQAQCTRDPSICEALGDEASTERDKLVECEAKVQRCLARSEDLPEAALVACENKAEACAHAAHDDAAVDAGATSSSGSGDVDDDDDDVVDVDDDGDDDADIDDDAADDDDDEAPPRDRPVRAGHGRGAKADAGVTTAE
jgi:hypothetical protein